MSEPLGVAIVTYNATDVIIDCLETLIAAADADGVTLDIAVVDNASQDGSAQMVREWAAGEGGHIVSDDLPFAVLPVAKPLEKHRLTVLDSAFNTGFAGGVNQGLRHLMDTGAADRVWILNPDGVVPAGTPAALMRQPADFGLMGGRVLYLHDPDMIQTDGGTINRWTGVTTGLNLARHRSEAPFPAVEMLDFVSGAHMVVSRRLWDMKGPMEESYFLYYEEVDWSLRRGDLPLIALEDAVIYHRSGTSIGSATVGRRASRMSLYFLHRARHRFMRRMYPLRAPTVWSYSLAKAAQLALSGDHGGAMTLLRGAADATPPAEVMERLSPQAAAKTLSPRARRRHSAMFE